MKNNASKYSKNIEKQFFSGTFQKTKTKTKTKQTKTNKQTNKKQTKTKHTHTHTHTHKSKQTNKQTLRPFCHQGQNFHVPIFA